ncbi:alanyl-tRNA editing protein [Microvirga lotononidis]|uniref:Putative metal-dependent hydrolase related to alanyl-tRNA synthetase HxxxH domain n=1 Tax=Microvirga lotononidis TaxID=864069 RepID=I4YWG8_9HYPH|nr:alanyl-tRNA editing protein [Microvirga lotononidis]EIM28310.1 putative metal-dependent hydrolase related to alanyl-tRNA synthetase HxxxH domain [Microvirga lotononidis]WQO27597.1 alanyl-tRNA editing protein [Microvirga lotononidis]
MRLLCQERADILEYEAPALDARPGAVLLAQSPVFPGGGGQLSDRAILAWSHGEAAVTSVRVDECGLWHEFDSTEAITGTVRIGVDAAFRRLMCELHTLAHIANSIVFREFGGALLTGAQLSADGTFRVDFDLPEIDNDRLRALDAPINDVIRQDLSVGAFFMHWDEAAATPGLFRSKAVSPPRGEDGLVRIVEIAGLDRQGCGGTHLTSTGQARPVKILKVDNKGRQNRRIKVGFAD